MVVGQKYIILPNSLDPRPHFTQGVEELASFTGLLFSIMKVKYLRGTSRNKRSSRREDRTGINIIILFCHYLIKIMAAMFIL